MTKVENDSARDFFVRWIERGSYVGVFENVDLSSRDIGHLVFMPLTPDEAVPDSIGKMQARDGSHGPGWRYRLKLYTNKIEEFEFVPYPTE